MVFPLPPFRSLDRDDFNESLEEIIQKIRDDNPNLDLNYGALYTVVAYYHSALYTAIKSIIKQYIKFRSLRSIAELNEDTLTETEQAYIDDILSNYLLERRDAQTASGLVAIVLNRKITTVIPAGSIFTSGGRNFQAVQTVVAVSDLDATTNNAILLQPYDNNKWYFTVPVTAEKPGSEYNLKKDTPLSPQFNIVGFVSAFAFSDFILGHTAESLRELINKLKSGLAARALSSRGHMQALLRSKFPNVINDSIIGFGDKEMLRDRHFIVKVSHGGKSDWYIRTNEQVLTKTITIEATIISKTNTEATLQFSLDRNVAPGFYEVSRVYPADQLNYSGSFVIIDDVRNYDLSAAAQSFVPEIIDTVEAVFSAYQTATIRFLDNRTTTLSQPVGTKITYNVDILYLPYIDAIQNFVNDRSVRHFGADCLVKAPVPAFVRLEFSIYKKPKIDFDTNTLDSIKQSLCKYVNNIPFIGRLYASRLYDVIIDNLPFDRGSVFPTNMDMLCKIIFPDGERRYLRSGVEIVIPELASRMVSKNTVQFFLSENDIFINVINNIQDTF